MSTMPKLPIDKLSDAGLSIKEQSMIIACVASRGKNKGCLRASKPRKESAEVQYVWRMLAFMISPKSQHQCMPVTASMNLEGDFEERADKRKELDDLIDRVIDLIPINEWRGARRWSGVL